MATWSHGGHSGAAGAASASPRRWSSRSVSRSIAYPKAWSPGFKGPITADVVFLDAKIEADLEKYKGKLKGCSC